MEVEKKYLKLGDIEAYKIAFELSNFIWGLVIKLEYLEKTTLGSQFVRSVDSISANIAEWFGRFFKKDKVKFYHYAMGSVYEAMDWNQKAKERKLIDQESYELIFSKLKLLPLKINSLIKYTNEKLIK